MQNRILPIKTAYNFRDLGGYLSENGQHVKWNVFLRSGDFPALSDDDIEILSAIPIKTVVDFRANDEIERIKDTPIPNTKTHYLTIDSGNLVPQFMELMADKVTPKDILYKKGIELMTTMYTDIVNHFHPVYRQFFNLIQNQEVPILFHCTAGKDRTGLAAALLLTALGIDKQTIYQDYLMTNECLKGKYSNLGNYGDLVDFFQTVRIDYLDAVYNIMNNNFGGVQSYLTHELDIDIPLIRHLYLED